jgi:hypothetical protein
MKVGWTPYYSDPQTFFINWMKPYSVRKVRCEE